MQEPCDFCGAQALLAAIEDRSVSGGSVLTVGRLCGSCSLVGVITHSREYPLDGANAVPPKRFGSLK